jgi:predicted alpha/beta superfamily hydrolase
VTKNKEKDTTYKMVYFNDQQHTSNISTEFKTYWNQQQIPADIDIENELIKVGLKPVKVITKSSLMAGNSKKKKRKTKFKMTNTHLVGVGIIILI